MGRPNQATLLWPWYGSTWAGDQPQLRTGGFCHSKVLWPTFRLGRRCPSSQWRYPSHLCAIDKP